MGETSSTVRVLRLVWDLMHCRYGRTIRDILLDYPASRRTLYRDLAAIEEAGLPLIRSVRPASGEVVLRIARD